MDPEEEGGLVRARRAKSGSYYGTPVTLKDNSRTKVTFVPFLIPHSKHTELAGKIVTWQKAKAGPRLNNEKSVSLSGEETQRLLKALRGYLAVVESGEHEGDYIVIKVGDAGNETDIANHDPKAVAAALTRVLGQTDILEHLKNTELSAELADAFRGAIRVRELESAVEQLRHMLQHGEVAESAYQKWCDNHYWALGPAKQLDDNVRTISNSDQVDKLIPHVASGLADIVELKRPDMDVLRYDSDHRNYYFSTDAAKAIGQCHRYLDVLHEAAAEGLRDHPEIVAYHPRATVIIGRSIDWSDNKTRHLHGLNQRLRSIKIMTYDHLLAQAEAMLSMVRPADVGQVANFDTDFDVDDDEIPF